MQLLTWVAQKLESTAWYIAVRESGRRLHQLARFAINELPVDNTRIQRGHLDRQARQSVEHGLLGLRLSA